MGRDNHDKMASEGIKGLASALSQGRISRRDFVRAAAALGVALPPQWRCCNDVGQLRDAPTWRQDTEGRIEGLREPFDARRRCGAVMGGRYE